MTDAKRTRGRPPSAEKGSVVTTWIPERERNRIVGIAHRAGMSVSAVVRSLLVKQANSTNTTN